MAIALNTLKSKAKSTESILKTSTIRPKILNAFSLFSGGGGLDLGFSAAGFHIGCSTDIDQYSCSTVSANTGKMPFYMKAHAICADIRELTGKALADESGLSVQEIDLVIGGPPCQAFSVFGRRKGLEDPRGGLVFDYLRIIEEVQPRAFLFENVSGLKTIHGGTLYHDILKALSLNGDYAVTAHHYQVADYGIPQYRDRIFFIGSREGKLVPPMSQTHGSKSLLVSNPYRTVSDALRLLPEPGKGGLANHVGRIHSQRIIDRYRSLEFGERDPKTRINKLHPDRPSYTIIVGSDKGGGKGHVHPYEPREVTPRESARMQTFPDWWEFCGTGRHAIRQVGNAVPPLFAGLLAEHIKKHIFEVENCHSYEDLIEILGLDYLKH